MDHPAKTSLGEFKKQIDPAIEKFLDGCVQLATNMSPLSQHLAKELKKVGVGGGKRLRGAFVKYGYQMYGGKDLEAIMDISVAIEMIHLYLLISDDFMDKAHLRHNIPTLNKVFALETAEQIGEEDAEHFGNALAVINSIILCHQALNLVGESNFPFEATKRGLKNLNDHLLVVGYGQAQDVYNEILEDVTEEELFNVLKWKTASYTYENPLHMGAIFAGATEKDLEQLTKYSTPGGIAFQIQDDILGLYGSETNIGKPIISDLKEGKRTILITEALKKANKSQRSIIDGALGNDNATLEDLERVKEVVSDTGSLDSAKKVAIQYVEQSIIAANEIKETSTNKEGLEFLKGIADYMIKRDL